LPWYYLQTDDQENDRVNLHQANCRSLMTRPYETMLGWYTNERLALSDARAIHSNVSLCSHCSQPSKLDTDISSIREDNSNDQRDWI